MTVTDILARLVSFPSVVGRPNPKIVAWIAEYARSHGADVTELPGPEGDRSNLLISIGPRDQAGYLLSGHMDVVPAQEPGWTSDPFVLRREGERLYGRGSSDMKGFLAAALACLSGLAQKQLARPLLLAFSYDEEAGCRGAPHLIAALPDLCAAPLGCVIGEPTLLQPVRAHKGKAAVRVTLGGKAGHSSRPDLGLNAIAGMAQLLQVAVAQADALKAGAQDATFAPPYSTLQVGTIMGGQAVNIIPDHCSAEIEARAIAGVTPTDLLAPLQAHIAPLEAQGYAVSWEPLSSYPALSDRGNRDLAAWISTLTGHPPREAVSFGTEAGLYEAAGFPAVICGPGDIGRAHKPDEYISETELNAAVAMIQKITAKLET